MIEEVDATIGILETYHQKDADNYRFDDEELNIEISDVAVLFDILDKEVN